jgi:biopolymer transport protein ExbB
VTVPFLSQLNYESARALTFDALYVCLFLLAFVALERFFYFTYLNLREQRVARAMQGAGFNAATFLARGRDLVTRSLHEYVSARAREGHARTDLEDLSSAIYLALDSRVNARLWVLDTIVTAAPLLGLLGTILGIMETFNSLSQGGISDPGAVSRGIGAALLATALGIATALAGLIAHNMLHRYAEHLTTNFKDFLLRL